ncbi:Cof-type HAD-IIB family hydrolase [Phycisphaerales bacterium AB-hyl4]|uniref:Cof-type HAD-IIB family hydrolase n=1 Tax=Natronomicrosphaera hydrolytica TaxID=3242702 RepID=A0ABV4U561_9BACT
MDRTATVNPPTAIRLIALDLDGTLLRSDKRLSVRCVRAIAEATAKGVHVVLASARPPRTVRELYHRLKLETLQINYNGALVHDALRKRNVRHTPMCHKLATSIVRYARKLDPQVVVSIEILDKWYTDRVDDELKTETARQQGPDFVGPLEAFLHVPVTKLMLLAPPERLMPVGEAIRKKFGSQTSLLISDRHLLQVVHPEVDKAAAVRWVAEQYGIDASEVMAIGDAPNDLGMLRDAGLGVAVGNAWPTVREAADVIVSENDKDGVAEAIRRFVLDKS